MAKMPLEVLFEKASANPNKPYLFQPSDGVWTSYTWGEVADQVRALAGALRSLDFPPGSRIALSGRNTAHWFIADWAIALAGHVSVGLYPKQAASATDYILRHSEAKLIFVGPAIDLEEFIEAIPDGIIKVRMPYASVPTLDRDWDELVTGAQPVETYDRPDDADLMTIVYTSGTTGQPKGVMYSYGALTFAVAGLTSRLPAQGDERWFSYLPLAHAYERIAVEYSSLVVGAEVHFLENIDVLGEQLAEVKPTRFQGVPLVFGRIQQKVLQKLPQHKLDTLLKIPVVRSLIQKKVKAAIGLQNAHYCVVGAAAMPMPLLEWYTKLGITILQGYGMSENLIYASVCTPDENKPGSVGREVPNANLRISDEGEIQCKHAALMSGYYKEPEKTAEVFTSDGYLKTGDRGRIDEDGYLFITGRVKDIFKTEAGKYIAPSPIEGKMARNTDIDQLCLVGSGLRQPVLIVSLGLGGEKADRDAVGDRLAADLAAVNATLEPHEKIAKIVVVPEVWTIDNGFMTPTMKVKRNVVEDHYGSIVGEHAKTREPKVVWV